MFSAGWCGSARSWLRCWSNSCDSQLWSRLKCWGFITQAVGAHRFLELNSAFKASHFNLKVSDVHRWGLFFIVKPPKNPFWSSSYSNQRLLYESGSRKTFFFVHRSFLLDNVIVSFFPVIFWSFGFPEIARFGMCIVCCVFDRSGQLWACDRNHKLVPLRPFHLWNVRLLSLTGGPHSCLIETKYSFPSAHCDRRVLCLSIPVKSILHSIRWSLNSTLDPSSPPPTESFFPLWYSNQHRPYNPVFEQFLWVP